MLRVRARTFIVWVGLVSGAAFAQAGPMTQALEAYESGDFERAAQIWEPLAKQGDPQAQYSMAVLFHKGQGRAADFGRALGWYRKAAEQDHVNSLFNLGVAYWEGRGVQRDLKQAVEWWRKAAELDYGAAQHNLATAYYLGQGTKQDLRQAIAWFEKAAANGYARADKALAVVRNKHPELLAAAEPPANVAAQAAADTAADDAPVMDADTAVAGTAGARQSAAGMETPAATPVEAPPMSADATTAEQSAPEVDAPAAVATVSEGAETAADVTRVGGLGAKVYPYYRESLPTIGELLPDSPVRVVLKHGDWVYVQVPGGFEVWVYGRYVDGDSGPGAINASDVRARPLPSTARNSYPLGTFNKGESVEVLEVQDKWKRVRAPERLGAWVKARDIVVGDLNRS